MITLTLEADPAVQDVTVTAEMLTIALVDGRQVSVPLSWYPRLLHGSVEERSNWTLLGEGYGIEWSDLDEHIEVEGLLSGRRSQESQKSFDRWLASRK